MLLSLASSSLLSNTGAWLLTLRDEARGNERHWAWETEHSTCPVVIVAEGKKKQSPPDHLSQYTHLSSEHFSCPFMFTDKSKLCESVLLVSN